MDSRSSTKRLTETDYSHQLADYASKRHPGTLNWLLESAEYRTWLESSPQTLFCFGEPGAGNRGEESTNGHHIAYIFFDPLRHKEQRYDNVALCISEQLASGRLPYRQPENPPWTDEYNWRLRPNPFDVSVSRYVKEQIVGHATYSTVFLVLDALDECPEAWRTTLLALLAEIQREHVALNVLVTWRSGWAPALAIQEQFENTAKLEIRARQQDLEMYMFDKLSSTFESQKHVISKTVTAADGRFLMAKLYLELLASMPPSETLGLVAPARTGPDGYDDVYTRITDNIASQAPHRTRLAERCLLRRWRYPSYAKEDVGRACIAYLLSRSDGGACKTDKDLMKRLRLSPLYDYAACHWGQHIQNISTPLLSDTMIRDFLSDRERWEGALQAENTAAHMRLSGFDSQSFPRRTEAIHLASRAGATNLVAALLAQHNAPTIINARDNDGCTPLLYTAQAGNDDLLEVLLADSLLDIDVRDYQGRTPISYASENGHASAVSRLLDRGADPNLKDLNRASPLWYAVHYGQVAVVRVLLESGQLSDLNPGYLPNRRSGETPLSYALENNLDEISEMLAREEGIDAHTMVCSVQSDVLITVLELAILVGNEGVTLRLLDKYGTGQCLNHHQPGGDLLVLAASIGSTKLVGSLLVIHGVDPNTTCKSDKYELSSTEDGIQRLTPLMAAAKKGHGAVVRLLLDIKATRPDASHDGASALSLAAQNGFRDIIEMLVADERVTVDQKDSKGRTPLALAAEGAHEDVVEALLMNETVNPNCRDEWGRTPLSQAMGTGYARNCVGVVRRLLADARVDPNSRDKKGYAPLYYAAKIGDARLVESILEHPRTDLALGDMATPLAVAASEGHVSVVQAFLNMGHFDVNAPMAYSDKCVESTLLSLAAEGGHMGVVELLLSHPAIEAYKRDIEGQTPLAMAAWRGHTAIDRRLLAVEEVDPNSRDIRGWTPLHMAVAAKDFSMPTSGEYSFEDTTRELLRVELVNADAADFKGRTPLSVACEDANLRLVDLLITRDDVDPDSRDTAGRNPLSWVVAPAQFRDLSSYGRLDFGGLDGRKKIMRRLLQVQVVDPNAEDAEGLTPLIRAIQSKYSGELVQVLIEREDLDVHKRSRDGRTPMEFAREEGGVFVMSLLRERGALGEDNEVPAAVGHSEHNSGKLRLPRGGEEPVDLQAGLLRRHSSSSSTSWSQPEFRRDVGEVTNKQLDDPLASTILLPLGAEQGHFDLVEGNDADLCAKCSAIDLDEAFSLRDITDGVRVIAKLGRVDETWKARECPMCRLIAAVSSRWRDAAEGDAEEDDGQFELVTFSSTDWLGGRRTLGLRHSWDDFPDDWIDTTLLGVVPRSTPGGHGQVYNRYSVPTVPTVPNLGFIGRLGCNCEHGTRAITITRVGDRVDLAVAKGWIARCREEHSGQCNPPTLAPVPHFRLINCATRRIVQHSDQVPLYAALSYVWGSPSAAGSGGKSNLKLDDSDLSGDGIDIGESVEAVVENAIRVALELGYGFLWVDRYCILQEGDGNVKGKQLQSMHLVYANAEVTLVATAGQASSSGLPGVSSRFPRVPQPSVRIKGHAITLTPPDPVHQITSSAWMTRGWTYQEGLLSRRRLFFLESEMSFECCDLLAREAIRLPPSVEKQMDRLMRQSWIYKWARIVSSHKSGISLSSQLAEYTTRKLTYQSDVLNAMLGILQMYATLEVDPVYHVCGVPILHLSESRLPRPQNSAASKDGGSDIAGVALAGFFIGLCWTVRSPGVRRPGFPSWSWTGWHGVVDSKWEHIDKYTFANRFDAEVSIVRADGIVLMPWSDYYGRLRNSAARESWSETAFAQDHMLDITASIIIARFYQQQNVRSDCLEWKGTVCSGDEGCGGDFVLTKKDSPSSLGDGKARLVPSLRRRLLEESWVGIVLDHSATTVYVLVVEEMPSSAIGATTHWERVGLLTINGLTLKDMMLERRKLRLA
ncbi:HET domain-containing protein [Fusarium sp. LHS14.1]|nr:HET domain-containing protein [Fusarium sp. LHS14.1]